MSETAAGNTDGGQRGTRRRWLWGVLWLLATVVAVLVKTEQHERDARFCTTSCHHVGSPTGVQPFKHLDGWATKGHETLECQACHATPLGTATKLLWQSLVSSRHVSAHGRESAKGCLDCHEKRPAEWRLVAETLGHRGHRGAKNVDCLSCHKATTHTTQSPEAVCSTCHKDERLHKATTEHAETCLSCHSFAVSERIAQPPTTVSCEKCHADARALAASAPSDTKVLTMKAVNDHALHGGVACQLCHNAHGKKAVPPPGQPICANCHQFENFETKGEVTKGPEEHRKCVGCHKPHAPRETALETCVACHESNAKGLTGMGPEKTTALKHKACTSCHVPHTWRAGRSGCVQCHKDEATLVQTRSPEQHSACTSCHDIHGPPPTGAICLKCHSKTKSKHVALAPERHKDCTSCHNPHAPRFQDTRTSCTKCHTAEVTQVASGPEGHTKESCLGCHQPHENPLPPPDVCSKCHADRAKIVATAEPPKHRTCTSCHEKHVFRVTQIAPTCEKCHGTMFQAASGEPKSVPHRGDCRSCHALHGSPGVPKSACFKCHSNVQKEFNPPNATHAICRSCHAPHTPTSTAPARCPTCHQNQASVAQKWPPHSAHAQACNMCHQPHDVRVKKACADCHAAETASAAGSKHKCIQCHAPHKEPPLTGPMAALPDRVGRADEGRLWWSRCTECHAKQVTTAKQRGPVHSDCKSCHQPHRFAIPTCTSCHKDIASRGLHATQKHAASCSSCHDPHVKSMPSPEQCLSCHTDRRSHEPGAKRCQACHLFQ